jgi:CRP-like cAMP-binding protein
MDQMVVDLKELPIFRSIPAAALEKVNAVARSAWYAPREIILYELDEDAPVCFVLKGVVRIFRVNAAGREQTLLHLKQGDVFNLPTAFLRSGLAPASAMAVGDVHLLRIPRMEYRRLVLELPELALATLIDLSGKVEHLTDLVNDLSLKNVRARLAKFLLQQHENKEKGVRWTHAEIATRIGTSREIVSRQLRAFVAEEAIVIERNRIMIKNPEILAAAS